MSNILNKITDFFKRKNVLYYIACGVTLLAFIGGVIASALTVAGASALSAVFVTIGLLAFVGLSVIGQERMGAALAGVLSFGALIAFICSAYAYFLNEISEQGMTGFNISAVNGLMPAAVSIVLLLISAIALNVFAWLRLKKREVTETVEKTGEEEINGEN